MAGFAFILPLDDVRAMLRVLTALIILIAGFTGGMYFQRLDQSRIDELNNTIVRLEKESAGLSKRNAELKETLKLVKRQIQTDRIAYMALQELVENSAAQQSELQTQLEKQRKRLESLQAN